MPERITSPPCHDPSLRDYHCHCDFSIDAQGTIPEYCRAGLEGGLKEICFTTHFDINPNGDQSINQIRVDGKKLPATRKNLMPYVKEVESAAAKFGTLGLVVRLGLEFGWYPNCEEEAGRVQAEYDIEYMLCGIHELDNICFCSHLQFEECFARYSMEEMLEKYFLQVQSAARSGQFDTIAHLDYYKKYGLAYYGEQLLSAHEPYLNKVFQALIDGNTCIEINTAGKRRGVKRFFPSLGIVQAAREAGVKVSYLGSDSHRPEGVGADFGQFAHLVDCSAVVPAE